jgi:hypothetical protein
LFGFAFFVFFSCREPGNQVHLPSANQKVISGAILSAGAGNTIAAETFELYKRASVNKII